MKLWRSLIERRVLEEADIHDETYLYFNYIDTRFDGENEKNVEKANEILWEEIEPLESEVDEKPENKESEKPELKDKMLFVRVSNLNSPNGNTAANQFQIRTKYGIFFQSYDSVIVFIEEGGQVYLDKNNWDYSMTTGKYRNLFLGEKRKETERKIKSGEYKLKNLN